MTRKEKALFFINSLQGGGAEKMVLTLSEELHKNNIDSVVITLYPSKNLKKPSYIEEWNLNFKASHNKLFTYWKIVNLHNTLKVNKTWIKFLQSYKNCNFKLITAHLLFSKLVALNSPYKYKTIYVNHISNNIFNNAEKIIYKAINKNCFIDKKQVFVSNNLRKEYENNNKYKKELIKTIYNPVLVKTNKSKKLHSRPYILFLGRLEKQKNPLKILELYNKGNFKNNYDLIYVGDGSLKNKIEKKIYKLNLNNNVHLEGYVDNAHDWIQQASLLASTSLYEGLPLALIEALMLNTPVISYNCPTGASEILIEELREYLIDANADDITYIDKMWLILQGSYPKINLNYLIKFLPNKIVRQYINFYNE